MLINTLMSRKHVVGTTFVISIFNIPSTFVLPLVTEAVARNLMIYCRHPSRSGALPDLAKTLTQSPVEYGFPKHSTTLLYPGHSIETTGTGTEPVGHSVVLFR